MPYQDSDENSLPSPLNVALTPPLTPIARHVMHQAMSTLCLRDPSGIPQAFVPQQVKFLAGADSQTYLVMTSDQTGYTGEELQSIFLQDQDQPFYDEFEHPYFEDLADMGMDDVPMHDEDVGVDALLDGGLDTRPSAWVAPHCLVVEDEEGRIAGFADFTLELRPLLANEEGMPALAGDAPEHLVTSFHFHVTLNGLYVRKLFRGNNAGRALLSAIASVAGQELTHLADQLQVAYGLTEQPFQVLPSVFTDWNSKSGKMAHHQLIDALEAELDAMTAAWSEAPSVEALDFAEVLTLELED